VHVKSARLNICGLSAARTGYSCGLALLIFLCGGKALQNAVAEGDTRTISMHHVHTDEDITITYKRDGRYDESALEKLNWLLRDWRRGEQTRMDPHLIDLVWEVQREAATKEPVQVVCGYRSPQTNAMLRRRSRGVARFSQHMLGHAMDFYIPGIPLEQLREIGLRLQRGGVGFYPESGSPFVHMDVGDVRMWPRMPHDELARLFPDGRTVLIPADGKPLSGYALALADLSKRGAAPSDNSIEAARNAGVDVGTALASDERPAGNPFAKLLGLAREEDDEDSEPTLAVASAAAPVDTQRNPPTSAHGTTMKPAAVGKDNAASAKLASDTAKPKLVHVAALLPVPSVGPTLSSPTANAELTANQVILARGYWQGPPDGMAVINPTSARASRRAAAPNGNSDMTGVTGPLSDPQVDRAAPELALAYAEQSSAQAPAASGIAALRSAAPTDSADSAAPAASAAPIGTTVAMKRIANQVASKIMTTSASTVVALKAGIRMENPWLRAIVLAPSVHRFLSTLALGTHDFRSLAALMVKPHRSVLMKFAVDPNPGLEHERFSGAAVVFVSTVSNSTHTVALQ
jgi:uncharacterized protein YcbK (DUF882 family)